MIKSFSTRLSIYILVVTTVLFVLSFLIYFNYSRNVLLEQVLATQNSEVDKLTDNIDAILANVELSMESSLFSIYNKIERDENFEDLLQNTILSNRAIYGGSVAFEPNRFNSSIHYFMQYSRRNGNNSCLCEMVGDAENYDYHAMDWYLIPKLKGESYWSEPYFDQGAGGVAMTTYSVPLYNKHGEFIGVATADVSLDWIAKKIAEYKPYPNSHSFMLSKNAFFLSASDEKLIFRETFFTSTAHLFNDTVTEIGYDMINQKSGYKEFISNEDLRYAFYAPIERTGWSVCTISFNSDIFMKINQVNRNFWIAISCGLLLIFIFIIIIINRATRPLVVFAESAGKISTGDFDAPVPVIKTKDEMYNLREAFVNMQTSLKRYVEELKNTTKERERIESELSIAKQIQMGMLPTIFPPYANLPDLDLYASLIPAKEVGGDLYDFFTDGYITYFTVGDASGKGVPASLLMAVTSSLFRSVALHLKDPAKVLQNMNTAISEKNDANMFITLFVGALDRKTGELLYSSAGHNPPVLIRDGKATFIDVMPNLPLGVMTGIEYKVHKLMITPDDMLFIYSDGLTEAENSLQELYSDERLIKILSGMNKSLTPKEVLMMVMDSVHNFVKENEQSDDLTMLALKLKI